jgi:dTDP-4-amino-4,6-dideoxygalactose transaminase
MPAYTFIACPAAVVTPGGIPVVAEVDESRTHNPEDIDRRIAPRTKAIMLEDQDE